MSHVDFTALVAEEGARIRELQARLPRALWNRLCVSPLDPYIERARKRFKYSENLLEFVVCFLEIDPWFDGSGYLKQIFLRRLKRSDLDEAIQGRLRRVVLDAVDRRGTREFKDYCRLAAVVADANLVSALEKASESSDGAVASRAKWMLSRIRHRQEMLAVRYAEERCSPKISPRQPEEEL